MRRGAAGAVIVGAGKGSVVTVESPDARIEGLTIRGSGTNLDTMDSGVFVDRHSPGAVIVGNRFENNLFGVYLHGAADSLVQDNVIVGRDDIRLSQAGNGVSIWNAPGAPLIGNEITGGRDGIFDKHNRTTMIKDNLK